LHQVPVLPHELAVTRLAHESRPRLDHVAGQHHGELGRQPREEHGARARDGLFGRLVRQPRRKQVQAIERLGQGEYRVSVKDQNVSELEESWVDVLLACPVKDWFEPNDRRETTDDLKPIRFE
jgi:hypothetical protein